MLSQDDISHIAQPDGMAARASAKALSKTFSKISSKQYRLERRKMKALEGKLVYEDAPPGGAIRKAGSFKGSLNRPPVSVERAGTVTKFDKKGRKKEIPVYKEVGAVIEEGLRSHVGLSTDSAVRRMLTAETDAAKKHIAVAVALSSSVAQTKTTPRPACSEQSG